MNSTNRTLIMWPKRERELRKREQKLDGEWVHCELRKRVKRERESCCFSIDHALVNSNTNYNIIII